MFRKIFVCLTIFALLLVSGCKVGRFVFMNYADITDYKKFPYRTARPADKPFQFAEAPNLTALGDKLKVRIAPRARVITLNQTLENSPTVAFMIIRNDSILYERYFNDYKPQDYVTSFSIAKAVMGTLTAVAIKEGKIKSIEQPITDFIPELIQQDKRFEQIRVKHLLHMTSGLRLNENYLSPFSEGTKIYYGRELLKYVGRLKIEHSPGTRFRYNSYNTALLGMVLERATGKPVTEYLEEALWRPLGCEFDARWSIDHKGGGKRPALEKTFCCLNARARDFARFGRLCLRSGDWDGQEIVPRKWFDEIYQSDDVSDGKTWDYSAHWLTWSKAHGLYVATGLYRQYVAVVPEKNLMIIHFGKRSNKRSAEFYQGMFIQILDQLNEAS